LVANYASQASSFFAKYANKAIMPGCVNAQIKQIGLVALSTRIKQFWLSCIKLANQALYSIDFFCKCIYHIFGSHTGEVEVGLSSGPNIMDFSPLR
jgi:hypothetical protein